jgi:hypothetical protein
MHKIEKCQTKIKMLDKVEKYTKQCSRLRLSRSRKQGILKEEVSLYH